MASDRDGLLRHSILLFAATQVANVFNLLFHVVMGRSLPAVEYSAMSAMLNLMLILATPLDAMRTSLAHAAATLTVEGRLGDLRPVVRRWSLRIAAFGGALAVLGIVFSPMIATAFHLDSIWPVVVTSLTIVLIQLVPLLAGALQGVQAFGPMAGVWQCLSAVRLFLGWGLVVFWSATAMAGLLGQFFGFAAAVAVGSWSLWRRLRTFEPGTAHYSVGGYLGKSLVLLAGFAVLMNIDIVLVRHYLLEDSKLFARAATISRTIIFLPMPIALAMFPKVIGSGAAARQTFLKAFAIVVGLVAAAVVACLVVPWLPLKIMYRETSPEAEQLVKIVVMAMAPLGITYLLMNYEMARQRFQAGIPLVLCAAAYVGSVILFHDRLENVILALGCASVASMLLFLAGRPWR